MDMTGFGMLICGANRLGCCVGCGAVALMDPNMFGCWVGIAVLLNGRPKLLLWVFSCGMLVAGAGRPLNWRPVPIVDPVRFRLGGVLVVVGRLRPGRPVLLPLFS